MKFVDKFEKIAQKNNSLLCIGLDPEFDKISKHRRSDEEPLFSFNKAIINSTYDLVCAYKPNIAFYEAYGLAGLIQLKETVEYLKKKYPTIPIILDAKRADIGNTAKMYAKAAFEYWQTDAVTVYPHLGLDSLVPFFDYEDKLTILLIKTSNPNAQTFQNLATNGQPYYLKMARIISKWRYKNFGIFVGAPYHQELRVIRKIFPNKIFLSAGIGAQFAQTKKAVQAGLDKNGKGIIFNASRSIIYAKNPRFAAQSLRDEINKYR